MKSLPDVGVRPAEVSGAGPGRWAVCLVRDMEEESWREWDDLNSRLRRQHPLLDSRFVRPLLEFFGNGREWVVTCRRDGRLAGAAIVRRQGAGLWRTFLPSQAPISPVLLPDGGMAVEFVRHLPTTGISVDFLCQDPLFSPFPPACPVPELVVSPYADTMAVSLSHGFDSYWHTRSRKLRGNISRYARRAEQSGLACSLERISSATAIGAAVARYGELESRGWKGREGTSVSPANVQGGFYAAVMNRFAAAGNAAAFELRMGDRLAASRLLIGNADFMVALKTTYDEELSDFAPGRVMLYRLLEHLGACSGPKRVEFYTKATADQLAWATEHRPIVHAQVFRWAWLKGAYSTVKRMRAGPEKSRGQPADSGDPEE